MILQGKGPSDGDMGHCWRGGTGTHQRSPLSSCQVTEPIAIPQKEESAGNDLSTPFEQTLIPHVFVSGKEYSVFTVSISSCTTYFQNQKLCSAHFT